MEIEKCICKDTNQEMTENIGQYISVLDIPLSMVIFGASGDLTKRKLIPALFNLFKGALLPKQIRLVGFARRTKSNESFQEEMREMISEESNFDSSLWNDYTKILSYYSGNFDDDNAYKGLKTFLEEKDRKSNLNSNRIFYLACDPRYFALIVRKLSQSGLIKKGITYPWSRVIIEKPFGHNIKSARELNKELALYLDENQIYRIDHYLGKETVQNILSFRFGNAIFEPLFNSKYVDHVQITVAETLGMEGHRGAYYDKSGALRDIIQNHAFQLLTLVALEPPAFFEARALHDEKVKLFQSVRPFTECCIKKKVLRGQYTSGNINGEIVKAYHEETGVVPGSLTETYVAMELHIDNWRWAGVPFYIRTGKRLKRRLTEIAVQFKTPPLSFFRTVECEGDICHLIRAKPNVIVFQVQPEEGISIIFSAKRPGPSFLIQPVEMDFGYKKTFQRRLAEAYERLLVDVIRGDGTLFPRFDEIEATWEILEPVLQLWETEQKPELLKYSPATDGPEESEKLFDCCEGNWRRL